MEFEVARLDPLFKDQAEYDTFRARHDGHNVKTGDLSTYEGNCYLGIDAGSTTTEVRLRRQSVPSRRSMKNFRQMHISYTPALPVTVKLS